MRRTLHKPVRSDFTSFQGPARVRASAIKNINLPADLDDANKMPPALAHLYPVSDEIHFPDQSAPPHRDHKIKFHGNYYYLRHR
jgi:hypothetical protein